MKIKINKDHLLKSILLATRSVASKSPNPALLNVLISVDETGLSLLGSNGDLTIKSFTPIRVDELEVIRVYEPGEALVNARLFSDIVRRLEGSEVDIEVIEETLVQIRDGRSEFNINSARPSDYPDFNLENEGVLFAVDAKDFVTAIDQTAFAASTKETQPILTALHLEAENGMMVAVATDTARLARKKIELKDNVSFKTNVLAKTMQDIARIIEESRVEQLEVSVSDQKILFNLDNTIITSRLVGGDYPSTKEIVPKAYNSFLEVNAAEFIKAMDRVALLSNEKERIVKLTMSEGSVTVQSSNPATGRAKEKIELCRYSGDPLEILFNVLFVNGAIRACNSEDVHIEFVGHLKPFTIRNVEDESQVQIVTPTRSY